MGSSGAYGFSPIHVRCLTVDPATQVELYSLAKGRFLLVDLVEPRGRRAPAFGGINVRWVGEVAELHDHVAIVDDMTEPTSFVRIELIPLLRQVKARLELFGPRRLQILRRPIVSITDTGPWVEFLLSGGASLRLRQQSNESPD